MKEIFPPNSLNQLVSLFLKGLILCEEESVRQDDGGGEGGGGVFAVCVPYCHTAIPRLSDN